MKFFTLKTFDGVETLMPQPGALSAWGSEILRGPAVTLALARALENALPVESDLQSARITFDLHSPVPSQPLITRVEVLRRGRRVLLADAELLADGVIRARARALFLSAEHHEGSEENAIWAVDHLPEPPLQGLTELTTEGRLYGSTGEPWTPGRAPHETAEHKFIWFTAIPLVENEELTPTQFISAAGDTSNIVTNWGAAGLGFINADVTISLARLPLEGEVGIASSIRTEHRGLAVGSALLFDRRGVLGTSSVAALSGKKQLSFR